MERLLGLHSRMGEGQGGLDLRCRQRLGKSRLHVQNHVRSTVLYTTVHTQCLGSTLGLFVDRHAKFGRFLTNNGSRS